MDISIIIVSFNVRYFLESCLYSVYKALEKVEGEIIVADNNSVDGTLQMLEEKFPGVHLIRNAVNTGFAKACNQGIAVASGRYILLLNPDTLIEETTLSKSIRFIDTHPEAGALGVKMIDGKGHFLPESKRALPTPLVAFYKIFGLARLFPGSKIFNRYYMGHLDENQTNPVEVLTGAFMLIRHEILQKTGGLDEDYFMYGEDIDLSYQIMQAGYVNYYFPETTIVHYKGESTKKGSLNYVILFYKAMLIFAEKHFSPQHAGLISLLVRPAIYLRAAMSAVKRIFSMLVYPLFDVFLFYFGYFLLVPFWEKVKFHSSYKYPDEFLHYVIPFYILIWLLSIWIAGGYRKPVKLWHVTRGLIFGMVAILVIYALLPTYLRFSRALILLGTGWNILVGNTFRLLLSLIPGDFYALAGKHKKKILVISYEKEYERISRFLKQLDLSVEITGFVTPDGKNNSHLILGLPGQLPEIVKINRIQEIIFSAVDSQSNQIIRTMNKLSGIPVEFKVALPEGSPIVGSSSVKRSGELYLVELNSISHSGNKLKKRMLDIFLSCVFIIMMPGMMFIVSNRKIFIRNCLYVMTGRKTWVGYCRKNDTYEQDLPLLPPGVLCPLIMLDGTDPDPAMIKNINQTYARNYHLSLDLKIIFSRMTRLGV